MKQNLMNQTVLLGLNEDEWIFTNPFWKFWRTKIYGLFMKLVVATKQALQKLARLWILRALGNVIRGIVCVLFVAPPEQERIERARMQAMQYRNVF